MALQWVEIASSAFVVTPSSETETTSNGDHINTSVLTMAISGSSPFFAGGRPQAIRVTATVTPTSNAFGEFSTLDYSTNFNADGTEQALDANTGDITVIVWAEAINNPAPDLAVNTVGFYMDAADLRWTGFAGCAEESF